MFELFLVIGLFALSIFIIFKTLTTKPKTNVLPFEYFSGIDFLEQKTILSLNFLDETLLIKSDKELLNIPYSEIKNAEVMTEFEETDKSIVGRAIVGGVLLGAVGAIVGGMSANGKKRSYYLKIIYSEDRKELYFKGAFNSENICNIAQKQITEKWKND